MSEWYAHTTPIERVGYAFVMVAIIVGMWLGS